MFTLNLVEHIQALGDANPFRLSLEAASSLDDDENKAVELLDASYHSARANSMQEMAVVWSSLQQGRTLLMTVLKRGESKNFFPDQNWTSMWQRAQNILAKCKQDILSIESICAENSSSCRSVANTINYAKLPNLAALLIVVADNFEKLRDRARKFLNPISEYHSLIRQVRQIVSPKSSGKVEESGGVWVPPTSFERKTQKYWVCQDAILRFCFSVLPNLPILVFGSEKPMTDDDWSSDLFDPKNTEMDIGGLNYTGQITSLYLDSDDDNYYYYHRRLLREEGALLFRIRWYSTLTAPDRVFFERKTHHESWELESSVKERFSIPTDRLDDYLRGKWCPDEGTFPPKEKNVIKQIQLANQIQFQILENKTRVTSRTAYERIAFQLPTSNDVRISMDLNLWLCDEVQPGRPAVEIANRSAPQQAGSSDKNYRFPHAVLELKIAGEQMPAWLDEMMADFNTTSVQVYKFSKYLSSVSFFHSDKIKNYPHWFCNDGTLDDVLSDFSKKSPFLGPPLVDSTEARPVGDIETGGGGDNLQVTKLTQRTLKQNENIQRKPKPMVPGKIEPKTFFANERTFIQWLTIAVLIETISLGLQIIDTKISTIVGWIIFPLAILFVVYALYTYLWRLDALKKKKNIAYDDRKGPILLVFGLLLAVTATLVITELAKAGYFDNDDTYVRHLKYDTEIVFKIAPTDDGENCVQLGAGNFPAFTQGSAAYLDSASNIVYVASVSDIYGMTTSGALAESYSVPSHDIEGITSRPTDTGILFLASENPENAIIEFDTNTGLATRSWTSNYIPSISILEGIAYDSLRDLFWITGLNVIYGVTLDDSCAAGETCDWYVSKTIELAFYLTESEMKAQITSNVDPFKIGDLFYHSSSDSLYILMVMPCVRKLYINS